MELWKKYRDAIDYRSERGMESMKKFLKYISSYNYSITPLLPIFHLFLDWF